MTPDASRDRSARTPHYLVGASLEPIVHEADGADGWYERDVTGDLDALRRARCSVVRVLVSWRAVEPQVGQYDEDALDRIGGIVAAAHERGLRSIVCLFADDRHASLSDVAWGSRRDARTDPYLIQRETALVTAVVGRLTGQPGVFGWQLGDEAFVSRFASREDLGAWFETLREAVREVDPSRPVGLGADAETLYQATGLDARDAIESGTLRVAHATSAYRASVAPEPVTGERATYLDAYLVRLARTGAPVIADALGVQGSGFSVAEEAAHLRVVLWSTFINRAAGGIVRRVRDLVTERREPYYEDPYEDLVGVADPGGIAKPAFQELAEFGRTLSAIDLRGHALSAERAAIVVPAERYDALPSLAGLEDPRSCFQAFVTARRAHMPVDLIGEDGDLSAYQALAVPSAFTLPDAMWARLASFVQEGGTLLVSHGGGDLHPAVRELFGVEPLGEGGPRAGLSCRIAQPDMLEGVKGFDVRFGVPAFALLGSRGATVIVTDEVGNPLLTMNQVGQGRALFLATPLERAMAHADAAEIAPQVVGLADGIYSMFARAAGCLPPLSCDRPEVELGLFAGDENDVLVLVNHARRPVDAAISSDRRVAAVTPLRRGGAVEVGTRSFEVPLGPLEVAAVGVAYV